MFSIRDINNAVLSSTKAMPQKDSTSDGTASFSQARNEYFQTNPVVANTVAENLEKKWYGNRDASQVATNRRVREIGVGTMNASRHSMSFVNKNDVNSRVDALARVRGGGYTVPLKVRSRGGQSGVPMGKPAVNVPVLRSDSSRSMIPTYKPPGSPYVPTKIDLSA